MSNSVESFPIKSRDFQFIEPLGRLKVSAVSLARFMKIFARNFRSTTRAIFIYVFIYLLNKPLLRNHDQCQDYFPILFSSANALGVRNNDLGYALLLFIISLIALIYSVQI
jgi:hypothetical protein